MNENKDGLNAVSLGSTENNNSNLNGPIGDMPSVDRVPVENLGEVEVLDGEQPENLSMDNNSFASGVSPVMEPVPLEPLSYDVPEPINSESPTPVFNEIGTIPPIPNVPKLEEKPIEEKPQKGGMNKTLFVLVILVAIAAVGVGVYMILGIVKDKNTVVLKQVQIEVGTSASTNINDYASKASNCSLDTTGITDTSVYGAEYNYKINCNGTIYTGKAKIVDTKKPEVTLKEVTIGVNQDLKAEDFIAECKDSTKCSYEFKDEVKIKEYIKTAASYHVDLVIKDEAGNEAEATGTLIVDNNTVDSGVTFNLVGYKEAETLQIGLYGTGKVSRTIKRIYSFKFDTVELYNNYKNANKDLDEVTYNEVTGKPEFDDVTNTLKIVRSITSSELREILGQDVPDYPDLQTLLEGKGYRCDPLTLA